MKTWSEDMGEISDFGGGYEAVCRALVLAGIEWIDQNPTADPQFRGFSNVFGFVTETNADAENLEKAMTAAPVFLDGKIIQGHAGDDMTGAMYHTAVQHVLAYKSLGWEDYQKQLRERSDD